MRQRQSTLCSLEKGDVVLLYVFDNVYGCGRSSIVGTHGGAVGHKRCYGIGQRRSVE